MNFIVMVRKVFILLEFTLLLGIKILAEVFIWNNSGEMYFILNKLYAEYIFVQNNSSEMYFILNKLYAEYIFIWNNSGEMYFILNKLYVEYIFYLE